MAAFAANSVLCRMALGQGTIDAASFSALRLVSGAVMLLVLCTATGKPGFRGTWISGAMLFLYAAAFSFAYLSLSTGTGALILFGSVQATMILFGLYRGERLLALQWAGLILAMTGLVYLVFPGLAAPPAAGSALMAAAGIAWGVYSLRGRGAADALADTAGNFLRSLPFVLAVSLLAIRDLRLTTEGALLAALSGAFTSGMGYVVWYAALKGLTATQAATVQLSVPVLAALGGVLFLAEELSLRLVVSAIMILVGIRLTVKEKKP
jgi:drug/metabolite transporter (DMT)-like permease